MRNLPQVFLEFVREFVSIIRFSPGFNVVIRHAAFSGTCPYVFAPKSPPRLAREKDTFWDLLRHFADPSSRRILSSNDIGTVLSFQHLLCVLNVNLTDSDDVHEDSQRPTKTD